ETIIFDASPSTATAPRQIVSYEWQFGTGRSATGMVVSKSYDTAGKYNVTLTVTDDAGNKNTTTQEVEVGGGSAGGSSGTGEIQGLPHPSTAGATVTFNASASAPPSGQTITNYLWGFGDSPTLEASTLPTKTHVY